MSYRVILDTDIGDDIDDAFALALLLRSGDVELAGVSTVIGDVRARVDLVVEMFNAAGVDVPVAAGASRPWTSRPNVVWETRQLSHRARQPAASPAAAPVEAMFFDKGVINIAIGPLTNFATALRAGPELATQGRGIVMAGEFQRESFIEWNIRCDPEAADAVFASEMPLQVIPWSIGPATKLDPSDIARLEASRDPLIRLLLDYLHQFWHHMPEKTNMYDPMTVVALLRPELFDWRRGRVTVELRDEKLYGLTRFEPDEAGPHHVAFGVNAQAAKRFMLDRLLNE